MMRDTALLFGDRLHRDVQLMVELGRFATVGRWSGLSGVSKIESCSVML